MVVDGGSCCESHLPSLELSVVQESTYINGATFDFLSTNMTTWSVHGHRVYKDPPNDYIFPWAYPALHN